MAIIEKAPAKINLGLDIVGRRSDGYHDLSMIMVSVDLNDYITVSEIDDNAIIVESNNHKMPLNDKNDVRSEERRVGKERRSQECTEHYEKEGTEHYV